MERIVKVYTYPFQLSKQDILIDGPPTIGNPPFKLDENSMLTWVDLVPEARFTHPTAYILISGYNTRVEKGGWWPVLNGHKILYGQLNPICITSPFELKVDTLEPDTVPFTSAYMSADKSHPVFTVDYVEIALLKSNPPKLLINVLGTVRTSGWANPRLLPRIYVQPPPDGIWEFDFVADPPTGIALQVITPIFASYLFEGDFSEWKGVRVVAETNSKEKKFGEPRENAYSGYSVIEFAKS